MDIPPLVRAPVWAALLEVEVSYSLDMGISNIILIEVTVDIPPLVRAPVWAALLEVEVSYLLDMGNIILTEARVDIPPLVRAPVCAALLEVEASYSLDMGNIILTEGGHPSSGEGTRLGHTVRSGGQLRNIGNTCIILIEARMDIPPLVRAPVWATLLEVEVSYVILEIHV